MNKKKFILFEISLCLCFACVQSEESVAVVNEGSEPVVSQESVEVKAVTQQVVDQQADDDEEEERPEPEITIGDACIYSGTYQCRCGDAHMGCKTKKGCLKYCRFDD